MRSKIIVLCVAPLSMLAFPTARGLEMGVSINKGYGRVSPTNTIVYAPSQLRLGNIVDGKVFANSVIALNPSAEQYAAQGWLPVSTNPPAETKTQYPVNSGFYKETSGVISPIWSWVDKPPRNLQLSKMKLKQSFRQLGIWSNVWAMVSSDEELLSDWNDSVVFDEQNAFVQGAFQTLMTMGLTEELKEFVLTNSITEIAVRSE